MQDYSKILNNGYERYLLSLGDKKVPSSYRINVPFQPDRSKYGKSDPDTLIQDTILQAKLLHFDLNKASTEKIRKFMEGNLLGIDCSGFVYHVLDLFLKEINKGGMQKIGFPKASSANVQLLTSDKFSVPIADFDSIRPADMIRLNGDSDFLHILLILSVQDSKVLYSHSSGKTMIKGVHTDKILNGKFPIELDCYQFNKLKGDGIYRLKALK